MSSTFLATCGNSSDTSIPLWPCFLNDQSDGIRPPGCPCDTTTSTFAGERLALTLQQHRLRVERVHLADAAVAEDRDDGLCLRREVRRLRRERERADRRWRLRSSSLNASDAIPPPVACSISLRERNVCSWDDIRIR